MCGMDVDLRNPPFAPSDASPTPPKPPVKVKRRVCLTIELLEFNVGSSREAMFLWRQGHFNEVCFDVDRWTVRLVVRRGLLYRQRRLRKQRHPPQGGDE